MEIEMFTSSLSMACHPRHPMMGDTAHVRQPHFCKRLLKTTANALYMYRINFNPVKLGTAQSILHSEVIFTEGSLAYQRHFRE